MTVADGSTTVMSALSITVALLGALAILAGGLSIALPALRSRMRHRAGVTDIHIRDVQKTADGLMFRCGGQSYRMPTEDAKELATMCR